LTLYPANTMAVFDAHQDADAFQFYLTRVKVNLVWQLQQQTKAIGWVVPEPKPKRKRRSTKGVA
jgi:hypothetical protein